MVRKRDEPLLLNHDFIKVNKTLPLDNMKKVDFVVPRNFNILKHSNALLQKVLQQFVLCLGDKRVGQLSCFMHF